MYLGFKKATNKCNHSVLYDLYGDKLRIPFCKHLFSHC